MVKNKHLVSRPEMNDLEEIERGKFKDNYRKRSISDQVISLSDILQQEEIGIIWQQIL